MINTDVGPLDGDSWEELIQLVYKRKYDTYQEMKASPGDYGIEGFVLSDGIAIQCYCPDEEYSTAELYKKQTAKINKDIKKLSTYESDIKSRLRDVKIKKWIFITPKKAKNGIHEYARKKETEVISLALDIVSPDFTILIHDIGFYLKEIRDIQLVRNEKLIFSNSENNGLKKIGDVTDYDENIHRKNEIRSYIKGSYREYTHEKLNDLTKDQFVLGDLLIRRVEKEQPQLYHALSRVINQYETEVEEISVTWEGKPAELIDKIRNELQGRFDREKVIFNSISNSDLCEIINHMVSKWIALCPLEIEK